MNHVNAIQNAKEFGQELEVFTNYVNTFYGQGGIYAKHDHATIDQIQAAIMTYITTLTDLVTWGGGDSLDRERVSMILTDEFNVNLY
jgi:hypothetical protein|tara:strand:- start:9611 stop:9871 length:261 start_codon:yes stop_codon:yes gene_type:complete